MAGILGRFGQNISGGQASSFSSGVQSILGRNTTSSGQAPTAQFSSPFFNFSNGALTTTGLGQQALSGLESVKGMASGLLGRFESLRGGLGARRASLGQLLNLVTPGEGRLSAAVRTTFQNQRSQEISNIRGEFASRGIPQGSSLSSSAVGSLLTENAQQENAALAEVFNQEIQLSSQLIMQQLGVDEVEANILAQEIQPIRAALDATNSLLDFGIQSGALASNTALGFANIAARFAEIEVSRLVANRRSLSIGFAPSGGGGTSGFQTRAPTVVDRSSTFNPFPTNPGITSGGSAPRTTVNPFSLASPIA